MPDYYNIIRSPIDLQTIETKLFDGEYHSWEKFDADVERMWSNSLHYNKKNNYMLKTTNALMKYYRRITHKNVPKDEGKKRRK